jgi:hypothetical protein
MTKEEVFELGAKWERAQTEVRQANQAEDEAHIAYIMAMDQFFKEHGTLPVTRKE